MNPIRWLAAGLSLLLATTVAQARPLDAIQKSGKLIVATEGQYPPYNFFEGSKLTGFEIDLADAVAKRMGLAIEWKTLAFDGLLTGLAQDRWDLVIAGHAVTDERAKAVTFTQPHFCGGGIIVSAKTTYASGQELAGKSIAVQTGTTFLDEAQKLKGVKEVKNYPQDTDARAALLGGRVDAWVTDPAVARAALATNEGKGLKMGGMLFIEHNAAAVAKGNTGLAEAFNKALNEMLANGEYAKLSQRYFKTDIRCRK
ncbi:MAG TPA: ABC transporter substrate-binding protein [Ideonella sp.]|jgi:polar amino acid transport system substrate-binding protein|nr:ABC transporter substrate-binding protein [Ideonella sp.]